MTARLSDLKIPYAVAGGMALNAHGYVRMTIDVDILVDSAGLAAIHRELADISYVPRRAGGKHLIDAKTQVQIDLLVAGGFAGDGRPNPIPIPSPKEAAVEIDGIRYVALPTLIELKLALGMKPGRLKHLADVQELIRVLKLPSNFADCLNGYVRAKYSELWEGVAAGGSDDGYSPAAYRPGAVRSARSRDLARQEP